MTYRTGRYMKRLSIGDYAGEFEGGMTNDFWVLVWSCCTLWQTLVYYQECTTVSEALHRFREQLANGFSQR